MNCAPITVTAAKTKRDEGVSLVPRDDNYPELFVGNLADINSCKSTSSTDPEYPDPGPRLEKLLTGASPSFASISGTSCVPKGQTEGAGALPTATAGNAGGSAAGTTAAASASATPSSAAGEQSSSSAAGSPSGGGVFATTGGGGGGAAGSAASPTTLVTATSPPRASSVYVSPVTTAPKPSSTASSEDSSSAADSGSMSAPTATDPASSSALASTTSAETSASTSATTKPAPSATLSPTGGGGGSGSGNSTGSDGGSSSSSGKSGPCTSEGMFNCIGTQYQQCASGAWTAMQALPGGTTCQQGESENLWARDTAARPARARKLLRWSGKRWVAQGAR